MWQMSSVRKELRADDGPRHRAPRKGAGGAREGRV